MLFKSQAKALQGQVTALTIERDGLAAKVTELQGQISASGDLPAQLAQMTLDRDTKAGEILALQGEIQTLKGSAKSAEEVGSELAIEIASSVSVPPVAKDVPKVETGGDILSQYHAITDPTARVAFLGKNKNAIYAASAAR